MGKPVVAIVGRPNVGKSTLFNKIVGEKIAIVEDVSGVTRDRIYSVADWVGHDFNLIDTGGLEPFTKDVMSRKVTEQAEIAIESADVIIFVVDIKTGILEADEFVANVLRKSTKPIVLAVNKVDRMTNIPVEIYDFYQLGLGEPNAISASQGLAIGDLLDEVVKHFKTDDAKEEEDDTIKVAIIGKPNVGKSSLINKILGEDRLIVSDVAGTTRDSIDTEVLKDGQKYTFIDTAGIRRKSKVKDQIEKYSVIRAVSAIERADVAILVLSADDTVSEQDAKIAGIAHEAGIGIIILVNKWDLIEKDSKTMKKFTGDIEKDLSYLSYAPLLFISAKTGQRVHKLFELINVVNNNRNHRVSTGVLNDVISDATAMNEPPNDKGRALRIYYATQVSVKPPTFVLFVNDAFLMHFSYQRYLENQLRQAFGYVGTPIHFITRNKSDRD